MALSNIFNEPRREITETVVGAALVLSVVMPDYCFGHRVLNRIGEPAVLWNIFPLHPHESGDPFSNRCHTRAEREATWPLLTALIAMIRPRRIVAIGRDAGLALSGIGIPVHTVRHPSYGGQAEFIAGVYGIYGTVDDGGHLAREGL